ncbi:histidine kinase [Murinocardiopsis flavida]|uniref:histidine kinase n=1 Tax=Murinocardiopsis flavida TaxID=645275 RepID=A0A2P8DF50_9ACTN|nr:HAMP domain-containing sensor histidine kinase [Murinocardiopsis flavida]PSK95845.1 histidine kinase [Murinocardiopsis flavida]
MRDVLLIALFAFAGAAAAGLAGLVVLRSLRHRSVSAALAVVAAVAVTAMLAGTLSVAQAMFLSGHDLWVVTMVCAMAAVVSLATALLLGRWVIAGSTDLTRAARLVGDERFTVPDTPYTAELTALARQLAATDAKLAASRERERRLDASRRELAAWISHDLRTPLAGLRAMAEALEDGIARDPDRYHRQMRVEVERLASMVDDLFELSRIEADSLPLDLTRVSVYDLVADALAATEAFARAGGVRLVGDRVDSAPVDVDTGRMTRVIANLLANAIRHTPPDGTVAVAAHSGPDGNVVLSVTDECGGIDGDDLHRVFDAGWRGSDARTPPAGAGLGLAIVAGIVRAHAGTAAVRNVPGGCRFEISLPAAGG